MKTGTFTSAAGAIETIDIGFSPDYFVLINQTTATKLEWFGSDQGDAKNFDLDVDNFTYTSSGGPLATQTGSTPVLTGDTLNTVGKEGLTVAAAFLTTADVCWWAAFKSD